MIDIEKHIPSFDLINYKDKEYIEPIVQLQQLGFDCFVSHFILHGSLATRDYIKGWSDVDALLVIKKETLQDADKLIELRKLYLEVQPILLKIDSLQHHGLQFITEYDLEAYPGTFLPPIVFDYSVSLMGSSQLKLRLRDSNEEKVKSFENICETLEEACQSGELRHHSYKGEYLLSHFRNDGMYQLKYLLSVVMLLPSYYLGLLGQDTYKKYSFDACPTFKNWSIVEKASKIRSLWAEKEKFPFKGNVIPEWVKEILGGGYFCESYSLAKEMKDAI